MNNETVKHIVGSTLASPFFFFAVIGFIVHQTVHYVMGGKTASVLVSGFERNPWPLVSPEPSQDCIRFGDFIRNSSS